MSDPQLMEMFEFDESDLQSNRNGRLSEKQKTRLEKAEKSSKGCSSILGLFLVGIGLVGVGIAVSAAPALYEEERGAMIALILGFGIIWPLIWGGLGALSLRRSFAKMEIKLKKAEGPINIVRETHSSYNSATKTNSEHTIYELHVGRQILEVDSELADVMMQGDVYAVYYADANISDIEDAILSVELLEKAK